jgi:hypothetical protein
MLVMILILLAAPVVAATPDEQVRQAARIDVELDSARLAVVIDDSSEPLLRVTAAGDDSDRRHELDLQSTGSRLVIARRDPAAGEPLRIELGLTSSQALSLKGRQLEVEIEAVPIEDEAGTTTTELQLPSQQKPGSQQPLLEMAVEGSQVTMNGINGASVVMIESTLGIDYSSGSLTLDLRGGQTSIHSHQGPLKVTGSKAALSIADCLGKLDLELEGGSLLGRQNQGIFKGVASDALLDLQGWMGPVTFKGTWTTFGLRSSRGKHLKLEGSNLDAVVERWSGAADINLVAGSLRGSSWPGQAKVMARDGTRIELEGITGALTLVLNGAEVSLQQVKELSCQVLDGSTLKVTQSGSVSISATDSEVVVSDIKKVTLLDARHSHFDLDLTGLHGQPTINLRDGASAMVQLSAPCQVITRGANADRGNQVTIHGCEDILNPRRSFRPRGMEGERAVRLSVTMTETSELSVYAR